MTRRITYANQLANSLSAMQDEKERMLEYGALAQAILGTTTELDGFACTPSGVPDLHVHVAGGTIFDYVNVDDTAFGTLPSQIPADTTHQILKYALSLDSDPTTFAITPPGTIGYSRNDLIQIGFSEADGNSQNIPFWGGVTNVTISGTSVPVPNPTVSMVENTQRIDSVVINVVTGVAAPTGTQTTPNPSAGFVGAWVITTTEGQTAITSGNIAMATNAPFIIEKLKDKISQAAADLRYVQFAQLQNSTPIFALDTGTSDNYVVSLTPAITSLVTGLRLYVKIANANTTAPSTLTVNGLTPKNIKWMGTRDPVANQLAAGMIADLFYDGTNFELLNPNQISLYASVAGTQNVAVGTSKYVTDTAIIDNYGLWDGTNKRFIAKYSGVYRVGHVTSFTTGGVAYDSTVTLYKNGVQIERLFEGQSSALDLADGCSTSVALNANDYLELFLTSATNTVTNNVVFQIEYLGS